MQLAQGVGLRWWGADSENKSGKNVRLAVAIEQVFSESLQAKT